MYLLRPKENKTKYILFFVIFSVFIFIIYLNKEDLKNDIGQEIRILLKTPSLYEAKISYIGNIKNFFWLVKNQFKSKKINQLKIDINARNFEVIRKDRLLALKKNYLYEPKKVNAKILWNNISYDARIRLKGMLSDHWKYSKQWSLNIELKNGKTILGMNEFSLMKHVTRQYPYYDIISKFQKKLGLLTPRYQSIILNVNGIDWGIMLMEEQFTEHSFEYRKLSWSPVYKRTNDESISVPREYSRWQGVLSIDVNSRNKIIQKTRNPNTNTNLNLI